MLIRGPEKRLFVIATIIAVVCLGLMLLVGLVFPAKATAAGALGKATGDYANVTFGDACYSGVAET